MNRLEEALHRICGELDRLEVRWALISGLAVSVRAEPRTTRDIDVAVAVDGDTGAESIIRELHARGYRSNEVLEQTDLGRIASVSLSSPAAAGDPRVTIDLMFASSGIEAEIVAAARAPVRLRTPQPPDSLPVATRGHLIAFKVLAGRAQDVADASALIRVADSDDLQQAREALDLISRRGYDRGKDLLLTLQSVVENCKKGDRP